MSTAAPSAAAWRIAASTTTGWAEHTEVTPAGSAPGPPPRRREISDVRRFPGTASAPDLRASSWAKLEVPSIGPLMPTALAPAALA